MDSRIVSVNQNNCNNRSKGNYAIVIWCFIALCDILLRYDSMPGHFASRRGHAVCPCGANHGRDGESLLAVFPLFNYNSYCSVSPCLPFPAALSLLVETTAPVGPLDQFSIAAYLRSTNNGQQYSMGSASIIQGTIGFPPVTVGSFSIFGFPFPADPTFFAPDPVTATFALRITNTGLPFTLREPLVPQRPWPETGRPPHQSPHRCPARALSRRGRHPAESAPPQ